MGNLSPLTPLGQAEPLIEVIGPVTIAEVVNVALASLAARMRREPQVAQIAQDADIPLPGPGLHLQRAGHGAFWLGPQHWMIEAPFGTSADIAASLRAMFGDTASITEQTDAWARFDVSAPDLPALFERLCGFDLRAAPEGAATRTVIDHLGCYIIRRGGQRLSVLGPRSSANALHHALTTAARSAF